MTSERTVLHVIPQLTMGGAGRSLMELIRHPRDGPTCRHDVLSLEPAQADAIAEARAFCGEVLDAADDSQWAEPVGSHDLVLVHYWNTPALQRFLRAPLPPTRLVLWLKVMGSTAPHVVTPALIRRSDMVIATSPSSLRNPAFEQCEVPCRVIPGIADFKRVEGLRAEAHDSFNVGYIGMVDFVKLHAEFAAMSSAIRIPELRVIVCGSGSAYPQLEDQAQRLGTASHFEWHGHVEDIGSVLSKLDVFGYPLCSDTYATSEKSLQEAMYAGIPPVVFPHGGIPDLVEDGRNGLIVTSAKAYAEAIEYLFRHPDERRRLGENAAVDARHQFDPGESARQLYDLLDEAMAQPSTSRQWNPDATTGSLDNGMAGTRQFIESLGAMAPQFATSLDGEEYAAFEADRLIARSSPGLINAGAGGIFHYRGCYPDDPCLRFWAGLILMAMERHALAVAEFSAAARLGFPHWRIHWYLAEAARLAGAHDLQARANARLDRLAPGFTGPVMIP